MTKAYVINNELYLRNGSDNYKTKKALEEINNIIKRLEEKLQQEFDEILYRELEDYKMTKNIIIANTKILDDQHTDEFYRLTTNGIEFQLQSYKQHTNEMDFRTYQSKKDLDKHFTSLIDYLDKATFVGRKFRRTKPIYTEQAILDESYTDTQIKIDGEVIVLYAMQDLFLVKDISKIFGTKYDLIGSKYTLDGNYEFYGKTYEEYNNIPKIYKEINEQLKRSKSKKLKKQQS